MNHPGIVVEYWDWNPGLARQKNHLLTAQIWWEHDNVRRNTPSSMTTSMISIPASASDSTSRLLVIGEGGRGVGVRRAAWFRASLSLRRSSRRLQASSWRFAEPR